MSSLSSPSHSDKGDSDEKLKTTPVSSEDDVNFEKETMRRVDLRIILILGLAASFAAIDRINTGYAYAAGMGKDLALDEGLRLNLVVCLYFIPDILLQLPGNLILRKVSVRDWLTFTVVSWGAVQLGMGFVRTWYELVVCRVLLGACGATLYPALFFIMTTWYKRHELQMRLAAFAVLQILASGVGPLLAYAFSLLDGAGKLAGWRWIFVMEGIITMLLGIVIWLFIPDFPDRNNFLTPRQTALVLKRIEDDRNDAVPDPITLQKVKNHLSDWTIWSCGLMFLCCVMPGYAQGYFLPIIISQMGWPGTKALLLSSAPSGISIVALLVAHLADKHRHRSGFIALSSLTCMTGICLLAFAEASSVRYFGAFLISAGTSGCVPAIVAFSSNNVLSQSKRSVQTALITMAGEFGGLLGTVIYRAQDAPRYIPGLVASLVSQGILLLTLFLTTMYFWRQNRLIRAGKREKLAGGQNSFLYTL